MATLRIPLATYRLQFNAQFRFEHARALVDYLDQLGVTDIYSSPLLQARRGSLHGYDVTDPSHISSEIGSEQELEALAAKLQEHRMGLLLDIVPNHMAAGIENPWWRDVLEDGPGSAYASFFDIDWHPPRMMLQNKVLLPILGSPYARALENQELQLVFAEGGFFIQCFDAKLPVAPKTYLLILQHRLGELQHQLGSDHPAIRELGGIFAAVTNLPERVALSIEMAGERRMQREGLKERLWKLYQDSPEVQNFVDENVRIFNGRRKRPASFMLLDRLLAGQAYLLSYWLSANDEINYRRFFTINNLVGVRVEDPFVFEATHAVVLRLIERGLVTGLRIDHVDGLRDPHAYLRRLQERVGGSTGNDSHPPFYVIVEKILARGELLPREWPICGATGYASLNALNGLFLDAEGCKKLRQIYESFIGATVRYEDLVYEKKKEVMESLLGVEMRSLGHYLVVLAEQDRYARDLPRRDLASALVEVTACLPVYRTYIRSFSLSPDEFRYFEKAVETARERNPRLGSQCFDFVRDVLMLRERGHVTPEQREARLAFIMRWQQFTGPIMAKGLEDSALYVYHPLISLNEVGGAPDSTGVPLAEFHEFCRNRQKHGHTLNATATHDTKRAEDVRARINVLSEAPAKWDKTLQRWARWVSPKKGLIDGQKVPDPNEEFLMYQTLLGAWPLEQDNVPGFRKRLESYMVKAVREARVHTNWARPNVRYEEALIHFIKSTTKPTEDNVFMSDFLHLYREIAYYGALNSLAQQLLKITIPGVPDFYQGSELWDFRLVDPDNRGPVDFKKRVRLLAELQQQEEQRGRLGLIQDLLDHWQDGRIKLFVTSTALNFRRDHSDLFLDGAYQALPATGAKKENVLAFVRHTGDAWAVTAVPRLVTKLAPAGRPPIGESIWAAGALHLPKEAPIDWVNILTGEKLQARASKRGRSLPMAEVFSKFPVALLTQG
ncbi:MAG: malto-oligosyltrehalose synthase [Terriglobia bacterium]|jgi:(1->4)-alpha-D-glucan 1-alpha-D-glucosylmutase